MGTAYLVVSRGKDNCRGFVLHEVDDDIAAQLAGTKWFEHPRGYAQRRIGVEKQLLHRFVMGAEAGQVVHHKDRDPRDNRRERLRVCAGQFEHFQQHNPRGYSWDKKAGKWLAATYVGRRRVNLGFFDDEGLARAAYEAAASIRLAGGSIMPRGSAYGQKNGWSKLTDDDVRWARWVHRDGRYSLTQIATSLGVSRQAIWKVVRHKTWTHVKGGA